MSSRRLPQELLDIVIGDLHEDKEALKHCSLVSKACSTTSSLLLFKRFRWPPCTIDRKATLPPPEVKRCCEDALGSEDSLAFLASMLSASLRLQNSIRDLHLANHGGHCTQNGADPALIFRTYYQVLPLLPRLRSMTVLTRAMPAAGLLPDAHLPLHAYSIETLGLTCSIKSAPTLLSPFKHISNLAIACPDGLDTDAVQVSSTREPIEVESICSLCWDAPALSLLQGVVDFQTVRRLMISEAPSVTEPALGYLIQAMPSLESLCYLSVDSSAAPFDTPGCLRLRYVGVGGHVFALAVEPGEKQEDVTEDGIEGDAEAGTLCVENGADGDDGKVADEGRRTLGNGDATEIGDEDANTIQGGGLEYCDWEYILRDLYILVTDVTEEITIVLDIEETYNSEDASEPDDVKDIARALWKAFSLLDWDGLHTVVRKCSNLRTLRISIEYGGLIEPEECGEILRKVLSKYLPKAIVAKTTVNTA